MLELVRERILWACERAGRDPDEVRLVAVTKGRSPETIRRHLLAKGQHLLGENRVQEWRKKVKVLPEAEWHFIGNLQTNKVKYLLDFTLIHSVNSERLADALEAFGAKKGHVFRALLEVNMDGEATKKGASLSKVRALTGYIKGLEHVELQGLMTMAPYSENPESSRRIFRALRSLRDTLELKELSMGMSMDFEVAIEEGATLVRVGSALFEGGP